MRRKAQAIGLPHLFPAKEAELFRSHPFLAFLIKGPCGGLQCDLPFLSPQKPSQPDNESANAVLLGRRGGRDHHSPVDTNSNSKIQFFKVPGHDHFSVIGPLAEILANEVVKGQVNVTKQMVQGLR